MKKAHCTLLLCIVFCNTLFPVIIIGVKAPLVSKDLAFSALEKALGFYKKRYEEVNLDSVFGLRVAEGFLEKLMKLDKHKEMNRKDRKKIDSILQDANSISVKATRALKLNNPSYFKKFKYVMKKTWSYSEGRRTINKNLIDYSSKKNQLSEDGFNERVSDKCMTSIMGSNVNSMNGCTFPVDCWHYMTKQNTDGYYITHQSLYFLLAEDKGCHKEVVKKFGSEKARIHQLDYFAANIYHQMNMLRKNNDLISSADIDLFIEQCVVLGMLGVEESMNNDILEKIVSHQDESGCFKSPKKAEREISPSGTPSVGRKLLEERQLNDGCLSHTTGLATGYFGMYINHVIGSKIKQTSFKSETRTGINLLSYKSMANESYKTMSHNNGKLPEHSLIYGFLILIAIIALFVYIRSKRKGHGYTLLRQLKVF